MSNTQNLNIRKIEDTDKLIIEPFNRALDDIDNNALSVTHAQSKGHWSVWIKNTVYEVGDVVRTTSLKSGQYLKCTVAGSSGSVEPTNNVTGSSITDGSVTWGVNELTQSVNTHNDLTGRSASNAHPISAITNLQTELDGRIKVTDNLEAGIVEYPTIVDNNNGTASFSGGKCVVYSDIDGTMPLTQYSIPSQTFTFVDSATNYVCLKIVNNSPVLYLATRAEINYSNIIIIATIYRFGNILGILKWGTSGKATAPKLLKRLNRTDRFPRESGLMLSESTGRIINITSGVTWFSLTEINLQAYTSATDDTWVIYKNSGNWTSTQVTAYDNLHYNNGTNMVEVTTNRYVVNWIFRDVKADKSRVFILLGEGDYSLNDAEASTLSSIPSLIDSQCIFVGRIIVRKDATTATSLKSAFTYNLSSGGGGTTSANDITITDAGNYYNGADVETALQEVGSRAFGGTKEWATSTNYTANQLVTYKNMLYRCTTTHTSTSFSADVSKWEFINANIKSWETSVFYYIGYMITYNGNIYRCKTSHTSTTFSADIANWNLISGVGEWSQATDYLVGQIIVYSGTLYRVTTSFTSGSSFSDTNLMKLKSAGGAVTWTANTSYEQYQLVLYDKVLYRVETAFTSGSSFADTNLSKLTIGYIEEWKQNHYYVVSEIAVTGGSIIRCITSHTSGSTYDTTESANWEIIASKNAVISAWKPYTAYTTDNAVVYNDVIYLCNMSHTSSATFTADMTVGNEKWRTINTSSAIGDWKQVTKLGATANQFEEMAINNTLTFAMPPVEILKFTAGAQDQIITEFTFSSGDGSKFTVDGVDGTNNIYVIFDGTVRLKTTYNYQFVKDTGWTGTGQYSEDTNIDDTTFKKVESVVI